MLRLPIGAAAEVKAAGGVRYEVTASRDRSNIGGRCVFSTTLLPFVLYFLLHSHEIPARQGRFRQSQQTSQRIRVPTTPYEPAAISVSYELSRWGANRVAVKNVLAELVVVLTLILRQHFFTFLDDFTHSFPAFVRSQPRWSMPNKCSVRGDTNRRAGSIANGAPFVNTGAQSVTLASRAGIPSETAYAGRPWHGTFWCDFRTRRL